MSMNNPSAITISRKPQGGEAAGNKGVVPGKMYGRSFMDSLERRAVMAWAEQDSRDLRRVIAKALGCPEPEVIRLLIGLMCQYRSEAASLRVGVRAAIDMADEAGREVWGNGGT